MRGGNLSNEAAQAVGIRFEGVIQVLGKLHRPAKAFLDSIVYDSMNIYILSMLDERKVMAFCFKHSVPYTRVIKVDSPLEIPEICLDHQLVVYYDADPIIIENVGTRGARRTKGELWTFHEAY